MDSDPGAQEEVIRTVKGTIYQLDQKIKVTIARGLCSSPTQTFDVAAHAAGHRRIIGSAKLE